MDRTQLMDTILINYDYEDEILLLGLFIVQNPSVPTDIVTAVAVDTVNIGFRRTFG